MSTTRKCEKHQCSCEVARQLSLEDGPCRCSECVTYRDELLDQYEAERGTWGAMIESLQDDRKRLIHHVAKVGVALMHGCTDDANEAWRALPEHLQTEINKEEERIDKEDYEEEGGS